MNTMPTTLLTATFVADRSARYERAATNRRLVRRAMRDRAHAGRDPDHVTPHPAQLVAVPATGGTTRPTGTASSPTASLPVDRVA